MGYSKQQILDLVFNYEKLHYNLRFSAADDQTEYRVLPPWGRFTKSVELKLDLQKAILSLSGREKFILSTIREGPDGADIFSDWLDITEESMKAMQHEVLDKMDRLMNPEEEHRGGPRPNAGRKKKSKTKSKHLIS